MNNLLSYCGLVDAKIRPSDKDLPVLAIEMERFHIVLVPFLELKPFMVDKNNCWDLR